MIQAISKWLDKLTTLILLFIVLSMLCFSLYAVIARLFSITNMWIDPLLRHFVFLSAFLGGSLAIGSNKHIKIDVLSKFIEYKESKKLQFFYQLVTLGATLFIVYQLLQAGYQFYLTEVEYGKPAFLEIHSSILTGIIPFGFGLLLIRGFLRFFEIIISLFDNREKAA